MSTSYSALPTPPVVDLDTWNVALEKQEEREKHLQERLEIVTDARRRLPMTPVQGDYSFVGPAGEVSFAELFDGHHQLLTYHFMYSPDWNEGCPNCTQYASCLGSGINEELSKFSARFILVSRAPYKKLAAWAAEQGIATPWYSASTEFNQEMGAMAEGFGDVPGLSVFYRDDRNNIFRTWRGSAFAIEATMPSVGLLQATPYGLQDQGEDSPDG